MLTAYNTGLHEQVTGGLPRAKLSTGNSWPLVLLAYLLGKQRSLFPPGSYSGDLVAFSSPQRKPPRSCREAKLSPLLLLRNPQFPFHWLFAAAGIGALLHLPASPHSAPGGRKGPTLTCGKETELFFKHC